MAKIHEIENWINGVMTIETVENYTKQLDLFSK